MTRYRGDPLHHTHCRPRNAAPWAPVPSPATGHGLSDFRPASGGRSGPAQVSAKATGSSPEGPAGHDVIVRVVPMLSGRIATMIAQFLSLTLIARTLGPTEFGALQLALVAFVYLTFLSDLGISVLGARDNARLASGGWLGVYIGAKLVLGLVALAVAAVGSASFGLQEREAQMVAVLAVGLIASAMSLRWLLQARERFGQIALVDTAAAAIQLGSAIALAAQDGGLIWAAATMASAPVVSALLSGILVRGSLERPLIGPPTRDLLRLALPAGVAVLATSVYFHIDSILLGVLRSSTEVGYYGAAYRLVFAALALPTVANAVALPVLSRLLTGAPRALDAAVSSTTAILLYVSVPLAAATSITAPGLVALVFGSEFAPAAAPLAILIWTCVTVSANTAFAALMLARRQDGRYMKIGVWGGIANLVLNVVAIPVWGMVGAAVTSIATEIFVLGLVLASTADRAPRILLGALGSAILPAIVMAIMIWPVRESLAAIPVGVASWLVAGLILGSLRPRRLRSIIGSLFAGEGAPDDR